MSSSAFQNSLNLQSSLLSASDHFDGRVEVSDASPDPLYEHDLLPSLPEPRHDLASEPFPAVSSLKSDHDGFVLRGKLHHAISPSPAVGVPHDAVLNQLTSCTSFSRTFSGVNLAHSALKLSCHLRFNLVKGSLDGKSSTILHEKLCCATLPALVRPTGQALFLSLVDDG